MPWMTPVNFLHLLRDLVGAAVVVLEAVLGLGLDRALVVRRRGRRRRRCPDRGSRRRPGSRPCPRARSGTCRRRRGCRRRRCPARGSRRRPGSRPCPRARSGTCRPPSAMPSPSLSGSGQPSSSSKPSLSSASVGHWSASSTMPSPSSSVGPARLLLAAALPSRRRTPCRARTAPRSRPSRPPTRSTAATASARRGAAPAFVHLAKRAPTPACGDEVGIVEQDSSRSEEFVAPPAPTSTNGCSAPMSNWSSAFSR